MLKIMVVDDEALIMDKIIYLLNNSSIAFEAIFAAGNGQEALNLIEAGDIPDIILSDVRMPILDGLELIEQVSSLYPEIRFIVISGYAEFEYAVKFMHYGVTNYVLKPVKEHELIPIVAQMCDEIVQAKQNKDVMNQTVKIMVKHKQLMVEKMLDRLLNDSKEDTGLRKSLDQESDILKHNVYGVVSVLLHLNPEQGKQTLFAELYSHLEDELNPCWIMEDFFGKDTFTIIFAGKNETIVAERVMMKAGALHKLLGDEYQLKSTFGISNACRDIRIAYQNSIAALKNRFMYGAGRLYVYETNLNRKGKASQSFVFKVKLAEQSLENKNYLKAVAILQQLADEVFINHISEYLGETTIEYLFNEYINIVIRFCLKYNVAFLDRINPDVLLGKALEDLDDNEAIVKLINTTLERIFDHSQHEEADTPYNPALHFSVVDQIIHYINSNINEDITLQSVADKFSINPSYLSRVFKAATEQGFVKYVTGNKIAKAKELLENSSMGIADIAHGLGFSDQQYFSRVFKKSTGMTPNEARIKSKKSPKIT